MPQFYPQLRCVLQHWYELRPKGTSLGSENNKRLACINSLYEMARREGLEALRGALFSILRGEKPPEEAYLPIGAGLYRDELPAVEAAVAKALVAQNQSYRLAATYAGIFFLDRSGPIAVEFSERVILGKEAPLVVQATKEALDIWETTKDGGACRLCGLTGGLPSTRKQLDFLPVRVSLKSA